MMKQTRKNPFAQSTEYNTPDRYGNSGFQNEISEDPMFRDVSNNFQQQNDNSIGIRTRRANPFEAKTQQYEEEDYSDYRDPNPPIKSNPPAFGNSGWSSSNPNSQNNPQWNAGTQNDPQRNYSSNTFNSETGYYPPNQPYNELNEPPLLEELGIDIGQIIRKIQSILSFRKVNKEILEDADLTGPLLIAILFGVILLLRGKVQFGYIYGFGFTGWLGIFWLLKAMIHKEQHLELYTIVSILGYCLLPFTILATVALFLPVFNIFWSTSQLWHNLLGNIYGNSIYWYYAFNDT